ncbi:MAG: hypothetical protein B0A82_09525 [Alkalinema sp. CACIAM 70d]|nr:MAG: hypothetical protein B0A82_09525 [Alkalinema sp. CACIAM 70d]
MGSIAATSIEELDTYCSTAEKSNFPQFFSYKNRGSSQQSSDIQLPHPRNRFDPPYPPLKKGEPEILSKLMELY